METPSQTTRLRARIASANWMLAHYIKVSIRTLALFLSLLLLMPSSHAQIFAPEPVQWQDNVKTLATYNSPQGSLLTRNAATSATPGWDGDAISTKWIYGDGWVEFRFDQTTGKSMALGLVVANTSRHWDTLDYCFKLASGTVGAFQSGIQLWSTSSFAASDVFRIERVGTKIIYQRNGVTVAQAGNAYEMNQGPLFVDTSFVHVNGSLSNCMYYGASGPEDVRWLERTIFMDGTYPNGGTGSKIIKTSAVEAWDQDAVSTGAINGDGELRFRIHASSDQLAIGLTESDPDANYTTVTYAILVNDVNLYVYELGVLKFTAPNSPTSFYNLFEVFSIRRVGSQVQYLKNGVPFYTSLRASSAPLFVDAPIKTQSAIFEGCQILGTQLAQPAVAFAVSGSIQHKPAPTGTDASNTSAASAACFYTQTIDANGSIHFAFAQSSGKNAGAGLSTKGTLAFTPQSMNYGVLGRSDGQIEIFESGTSRGLFGPYTNTDRFEVRRINGTIEYYRNGTLLRSVSSSTGALAGAVVMNEQNAGVNDIYVFNGRKPIEWRRFNRTTGDWSFANGSSLTRDGSAAGWTADALGSKQLVGDGYIQCRAGDTTSNKAIGLSPSDKGNNIDDLQWAIQMAAGTLKVREGGVEKGSFGSYSGTDVFRIRRTGSFIRYYKLNADGTEPATPLYTSLLGASSALVVDCSLNTPNSILTGAEIYYEDSDADGLDDQWELGEFGSLAQTASGDLDSDGVDNIHEFYNGSVPDNHAPTVNLTVQTTVSVAPGTVKLIAAPADVDGNLSRVDFYENSVLVGTATGSPWEVTLTGKAAGTYNYQATAVDSENLTGSASGSATVVNPVLNKISGDSQSSATNIFLPNPLIVDVRAGVGGSTIAGRSVTFTVMNGNGGVSTTSSGPTSNSVTVTSNASGLATVYFKQPTSINFPTQIQAVASPGSPVTFTATTTAVVGNAFVGHWKLDETNGITTAADSSNSNNPGIVDANPYAFFTKGYNWTSGPSVGGLGIQPDLYTGQAGLAVANTNNRVLPATGQPYSLAFWFRANNLAAGNLYNLFCNETYLQDGLRIGIDTGQYYTFGTPALMVWSTQSGGSMFTRFSSVLSTQRWYHLSVTYSGTTVKIYLDGVLLGTQTANILSNTNYLRFGVGIGGCRNLDGVIDDVRFYQKELTSTEIGTIRDSLTDGDSLTDSWERLYFGDLAQSPTGDWDSDGATNLAELINGSNPKLTDTDGDGLSDGLEITTIGSSPINGDTDGDGMPDMWEYTYGTDIVVDDAAGDLDSDGVVNLVEYQYGSNPTLPDSDFDGLTDSDEINRGTNPASTDTDSDGMPDGWEVTHNLNPLADDSTSDEDSDGLPNLNEFLHGTDPRNPDSDFDGLTDGAEVNTYGTIPTLSDSDNDGMPDGWEVNNGLNPSVDDASGDPDSDGLTNLLEYFYGSNPNSPDTDGDSLYDGAEVFLYGSSPASTDTDGDGLPDALEVNSYGTNPASADTDSDGMPDPWELGFGLDPLNNDSTYDPDGDGLYNGDEYLYGTNPQNSDTDGDGLSDSEIFSYGSSPLNVDSDGDGLWDGIEVTVYGTSPTSWDTDFDGMPDVWEISHGTNPTSGDGSNDNDGDQLSNYDEYLHGTEPQIWDTDGDGHSDGYEVQMGSNPLDPNSTP